ncbi:MAG: tetratricopeptide repeat protein, partial [Desulfobulbaceae bacterium]|nr:tetratricopeptide repeat protein [Desulfobulbaceae bacterium]
VAEYHLRQSLIYFEKARNTTAQASDFVRLSELEFARNLSEAGWAALENAEERLRLTEISTQAARIRRDIANRHLWNNNLAKAEALLKLSLEDFRILNNKSEVAWTLHCLGDLFFSRNEYSRAESFYHDAIALFQELKIAHGIGYAVDHLGQMALQQGKIEDARRHFEYGLEIFRDSGLKSGMGYLLYNLGDCERSAGRWQEALRHYSESLKIWQELGNRERIKLAEERLKSISDNGLLDGN